MIINEQASNHDEFLVFFFHGVYIQSVIIGEKLMVIIEITNWFFSKPIFRFLIYCNVQGANHSSQICLLQQAPLISLTSNK